MNYKLDVISSMGYSRQIIIQYISFPMSVTAFTTRYFEFIFHLSLTKNNSVISNCEVRFPCPNIWNQPEKLKTNKTCVVVISTFSWQRVAKLLQYNLIIINTVIWNVRENMLLDKNDTMQVAWWCLWWLNVSKCSYHPSLNISYNSILKPHAIRKLMEFI
jgi:hypothetical protein